VLISSAKVYDWLVYDVPSDFTLDQVLERMNASQLHVTISMLEGLMLEGDADTSITTARLLSTLRQIGK
jgi:hypothetical protein